MCAADVVAPFIQAAESKVCFVSDVYKKLVAFSQLIEHYTRFKVFKLIAGYAIPSASIYFHSGIWFLSSSLP